MSFYLNRSPRVNPREMNGVRFAVLGEWLHETSRPV